MNCGGRTPSPARPTRSATYGAVASQLGNDGLRGVVPLRYGAASQDLAKWRRRSRQQTRPKSLTWAFVVERVTGIEPAL